MKAALLPLLIASLLLLQACRQEKPTEAPEFKPLAYTSKDRSPLFHEKNIGFQLDTGANTLQVTLELHLQNNFPFPINQPYKDTLRNTAFEFEFLENGKPILSDYPRLQQSLQWKSDSSKAALPLLHVCDTLSLQNTSSVSFSMPLYAFHRLKKGKHQLELSMRQRCFTEEVYVPEKKEGSRYIHLYDSTSLLYAKVNFELNIPPIYCSELIGCGLQLKNDSTFTPAGMDNTLWNSSYPDIYWSLQYPKGEYYAQTDYQKSTDAYVGKDTFLFYHYYAEDSVGIAVFDHDNLSRDDVLGYWWGATQPLERKPVKRIGFDNVKWFDVMLNRGRICNP